MHIAEVVTIAKSLPLLRLNTYKSLILSYSADYRRIFLKKLPQKLFFVVSLSAGLSETLRLLYVVLVVQVVFPMSAASSARRRSKDGLLFLKKLPQKLFFVVSLSAGLSETLRLL